MEWTEDAEKAIKKVPIFVRKRVKERVEKEAQAEGKQRITLAEVTATQKRYLAGMESEIRGYRLETCFGANGCPNRAGDSSRLFSRLEEILQQADILNFLKSRVKEPLKFHHEFSVTLADCPNACSQPQIRDVGIIAAAVPQIDETSCTLCEECVKVCKDQALMIEPEARAPRIVRELCLNCALCAGVCASQSIQIEKRGFRVMLGGRLGRHPRLGMPLDGLFSEDQVVNIVERCLDYYKKNSHSGERFASIVQASDLERFAE
jgi:dissimilatory sulfite reductase (desulfoviridin) alpha/beta subunit